MPQTFTSSDFCEVFQENHSRQYEAFLEIYARRHHDRAHAVQIVHSQLMHTVNDRFSHLARKVRTLPNPKGGAMSEWRRA